MGLQVNRNSKFITKQNDSAITLQAVLEDQSGTNGAWAPVDLTGATVTLTVKNIQSGYTPIAAQACTINPDQTTNKGQVSASCVIARAGTYAAEFTVIFPSLAQSTFPRGEGEDAYFTIVVGEKL